MSRIPGLDAVPSVCESGISNLLDTSPSDIFLDHLADPLNLVTKMSALLPACYDCVGFHCHSRDLQQRAASEPGDLCLPSESAGSASAEFLLEEI